MDVISSDGALSPSDFFIAAHSFIEKWKRYNPTYPPWSWVSCEKKSWIASQEVEKYLSLESICLLSLREDDHGDESQVGEDDTSCSQEEEPVDSATLVESCDHEIHYYDFHIVYSASYRVPVLYFRSYFSDGQPLVLDEIEEDFPTRSAKVLLESKWTFITQEVGSKPKSDFWFAEISFTVSFPCIMKVYLMEEHPYLNRPWYKLHPCGTGEWMKLLFLSNAAPDKQGVAVDQYLVSWFSVVGQVVGLRIPLEMLNDRNQL